MRNSSNLDAIRAIAVLLVVVSHVLHQVIGATKYPVFDPLVMGRVGVAIFFVHTTLVLMASLERHGPAVIPFYVRRFFRIYPLSAAVVLLMALLSPPDIGRVLSNLLLVQNITGHSSSIGPLWSLPYEVQMYLALPAIYAATLTHRHLLWIGLLFVGSVLLMLSLPADSSEFRLLRFVPCFLPGVLAFVLARRADPTMSPMVLLGVVAIGIAGIPLLVAVGMSEIHLFWCLCLALGLTIPACREVQDGYFARASKLIAKYSYGIYLTHIIALSCYGMIPGPAVVQWAAVLILIVGLPYIAYHGIEKRGIALGARLAASWGSKQRQNLGSAARVD